MTTTALSSTIPLPAEPTLAVAAGCNLVAAGIVFGLANLFQYGVVSGALGLHPAVLSISWPLAVGLFLTVLFRLRRSGGAAAKRAATWSRLAVLAQAGAALTLLAASFVSGDWRLMTATSAVAMTLHGGAWLTATLRGGRPWMAAIALGCFATAGGILLVMGTPTSYLAQAGGLFAFALVPGLLLASGRAR